MQDRADGAARSRGGADGGLSSNGLSLQAVRDIAEEVGLDTKFIDQAAASLLHDPPGKGPGLLGGAITHQVSDTFARTLSQAQRVELLDVIRESLHHPGEIRDVMGGIEWRAVGQVSRTTVTIHSDDESVSIRVFSDLSGLATLTWLAPIVSSLVVGGLVAGALQATVLGSFAIVGIAGAVGVGTARTIWAATTKFFRRRTERLREEIALYLNR